MKREDNRQDDELRPFSFIRGYTKHAAGSVLAQCGNTKVLCTAMCEDRVPSFLSNTGKGWVTAEYSMLPSSTTTRKFRDRAGKVDSRSTEIQRLIGRALRGIISLDRLGERTIWVDCDVIQADGGTRTTAISGAYVALADAVNGLLASGKITQTPLLYEVAAISVGVVNGDVLLDLAYSEDSIAEVDMNVVMTAAGDFVEIQGTAETKPFSPDTLSAMLKSAQKGVTEIIEIQRKALADSTEG